jgi:hypothetical protein
MPPDGAGSSSSGAACSFSGAAEPEYGAAEAPRAPPEELFVHKLVLFSGSDFFQALISRWSGSSDRSDQVLVDHGDFAVMTLLDEASFRRFKQMVCFLYAQKLDEGMEHCELAQLYLLGDEYGVASLRCACLQQLSTWPTSKWLPEADKQLFSSLTAVMSSDAASAAAASAPGDQQLAEAAKVVIDQLQCAFLDLESAWQSEGMQAAFCCLPATVAAGVLSSSSLSVACEDAALVAALSWLRTGGQDAALAERMQVLHAVRLLYLSPWLLSWLLFYAPEGAELLPPQEKAFMLQCQSFASADDRKLMAGVAGQAGLSGAPRCYLAVSAKQLEFGIPEQGLLDAVQECFKDDSVVDVRAQSDVRFHRGVEWRGEVRISRPGSGSESPARVWVGVVPSLELEGDVIKGPCSYLLGYKVGSRALAYNTTNPRHSPQLATRVVPEWGWTLASVKPGEDARQALNGCFTDGRLTVTATLY